MPVSNHSHGNNHGSTPVRSLIPPSRLVHAKDLLRVHINAGSGIGINRERTHYLRVPDEHKEYHRGAHGVDITTKHGRKGFSAESYCGETGDMLLSLARALAETRPGMGFELYVLKKVG